MGATVCAIALSLAVASAAQAQTCYDLSQQRSALQGRMARLVADYPGTHVVIGMCAATASSTYNNYIAQGRTTTLAANEASATFAACAAVGCLLVGFRNCIDVTSRWFELSITQDEIDQQIRRQRCPA